MFRRVSRARNAWRLGRLAILSAAIGLVHSSPANSTVVRFNTVRPDNQPGTVSITVRLYDTATPLNVANFLHYVNNSLYNGTFFHRDIPGFVLQGGGYTYNSSNNTAPHIATFPPVQNEFGISNLRGTIAMAKLGGDPNSATSEFFFNLSDTNAGSPPNGLDYQNGGFTVFGRVIGTGMSVVDSIAALPVYDIDGAGSTFDNVPLRTPSIPNGFMFVNSVQILTNPAGDFDGSGAVNSTDYGLWAQSFGSKILAEADGNGNGVVDAADYVLFRKTLPHAGSASELSAVSAPEPSCGMLILLGSLLLPFYRGRFIARRNRKTC